MSNRIKENIYSEIQKDIANNIDNSGPLKSLIIPDNAANAESISVFSQYIPIEEEEGKLSHSFD